MGYTTAKSVRLPIAWRAGRGERGQPGKRTVRAMEACGARRLPANPQLSRPTPALQAIGIYTSQ